MALEGTIKVPAVGPVKKTWAAAGIGVLVIILGVAYYRHSKNAKTAAAAPGTAAFNAGFGGTDPFPPDGTVGDPTDPNSTDPNTGQTYGDEEASAGGGGFPGITGGGGGGQQQGPGSFTSNAAWDQAAQAYLEGIGSNPQTVAAALGKYLHGDHVTPAEQTVIESAIGAEGLPPVSGPGGFPPNIRVRKPGPPPPKKTKVRVPNVTQKTYQFAVSILAKDGLKAHRLGVGPAVVSETPRIGTEVDKGSTVTLHMGQFHEQPL